MQNLNILKHSHDVLCKHRCNAKYTIQNCLVKYSKIVQLICSTAHNPHPHIVQLSVRFLNLFPIRVWLDGGWNPLYGAKVYIKHIYTSIDPLDGSQFFWIFVWKEIAMLRIGRKDALKYSSSNLQSGFVTHSL